jgi:hypothetical protein
MCEFSRSTATIEAVLLPAISRAAPVRRSARSDPSSAELRAAPGERARLAPSLQEHADATQIRRPMHVAVARRQTKTASTELPRDAGAQNRPVRQHACTTLKRFSAYPTDAKDPASASEIAFFSTGLR